MYFCVAPITAPAVNQFNNLVSSSPNKTPAVNPVAPPTKGLTATDVKLLTAQSTELSVAFNFSNIKPSLLATNSAYFLILGCCALYNSALVFSNALVASFS